MYEVLILHGDKRIRYPKTFSDKNEAYLTVKKEYANGVIIVQKSKNKRINKEIKIEVTKNDTIKIYDAVGDYVHLKRSTLKKINEFLNKGSKK